MGYLGLMRLRHFFKVHQLLVEADNVSAVRWGLLRKGNQTRHCHICILNIGPLFIIENKGLRCRGTAHAYGAGTGRRRKPNKRMYKLRNSTSTVTRLKPDISHLCQAFTACGISGEVFDRFFKFRPMMMLQMCWRTQHIVHGCKSKRLDVLATLHTCMSKLPDVLAILHTCM